MTRILIALLSMALVATGGLVAAIEGFASPEPVRSISRPRHRPERSGQLERLWRR
jgi:hypothetical protein